MKIKLYSFDNIHLSVVTGLDLTVSCDGLMLTNYPVQSIPCYDLKGYFNSRKMNVYLKLVIYIEEM